MSLGVNPAFSVGAEVFEANAGDALPSLRGDNISSEREHVLERRGEDDDDSQPSLLPNGVYQSELPQTCTVLVAPNGANVYIVGTAHFSLESQSDVSQVIQAVKPDVVMIELCATRVNILSMDEERLLEEAKNINASKVHQAIQQSGVVQGVMYILLLSMSAHITKQLGMAPGGEFRRAYNEANKIPGCKLLFGDRPIQITLQRAIGSLSVWQKCKLAWHMLTSNDSISKEDVEKCKQKDILEELLREMTGEFPLLSQVFVDERDVYLTHSLRAATQMPSERFPPVVVGVVGIGHVAGIVKNWNLPLDVASVMSVPPPSKVAKVARFILRSSILGLGAYSVYRLYRRIAL